MKPTIFAILTLLIGVVPGYSINWEFITSVSTPDGIEISYYIDTDEIGITNGIRSYKEKRIYTRGKSLRNIGTVQIIGYFDCDNEYYVKGSISFFSPEDKYLDGYIFTGDANKWEQISPGSNRMIYEYVCTFNKR
ncbi:MAG TPA: hypothetical protein VGA95_04580 [Thermodesulfobacteriota bacterium]